MAELSFHFRRATLEDLDVLRGLWQTALFSPIELEKRLTEFQLVEGEDDRLLGCVGMKIQGEDAWIHHEAFTHPDTETAIRTVLWNRLKVLFGNQGVHRIWTCEKAPFWKQSGFRIPTAEERSKFPVSFGPSSNALLVYGLRNQKAEKLIESHLLELEAMRQEEEDQLDKRTRLVRIIAWSLAGFFMVLLIYFTIRGFMALPQLQRMR